MGKNRSWWIIVALLGGAGVILGAMGAHALEGKLSQEHLDSFETGVRYHLLHTLFLLGTALAMQTRPSKYFRYAFWLAFSGILCFSGSIYLLATRSLTGLDGIVFLGPVTPLGGLLLITAWLMLLFVGFERKD